MNSSDYYRFDDRRRAFSVLRPDTPPVTLNVDPGKVKRIRLSVIDARKDARITKFFYPVWASPQLK